MPWPLAWQIGSVVLKPMMKNGRRQPQQQQQQPQQQQQQAAAPGTGASRASNDVVYFWDGYIMYVMGCL